MRRVFSSGLVLLCTRLTLAVVGVFTVSMAIHLFALANRNTPKTVTPPVPRTDEAPLKKRFAFLGNFKRCSWVGGVGYDGSTGRIPGPSSYFNRAYVVLEPAQTKELLDRYEWAGSNSDVIPAPPQPLGKGFPQISGPSWKSGGMIRSLSSLTSYCDGIILLQPEHDLLYLDLKNLN
jgi:hypothetical protein